MNDTIFTVTNDEYSNEPIDGTQAELQEQFDSLNELYPDDWNVKLVRRIGADGDALIDENNGKVVAEEKI
jgi:hypothetical protein